MRRLGIPVRPVGRRAGATPARGQGRCCERRGSPVFPNHEALLAVPDLSEKKQALLAGLNALTAGVVQYAADQHGLTWTEEKASGALERLTEDFGAELATARREGGLAADPELRDDEALTVVYGFARGAVERDPENFERIVAMVQGTMIANALYFEDVP